MRPIDYLKPLGVALKPLGVAAAVLALNLLLTTLAITVYSLLIEPSHPQSHYTAMAPVIGAWTGPAGGMVLMLVAGWWFARRRPERKGLVFIAVVWAIYLAIDAALGVAIGGVAAVLTVSFGLSLGGALLAGLAGAWFGARRAA